ncbi:MAG: VOC family protein [Janthinobacterium lividum]
MAAAKVVRIDRIALTVADLAGTSAFYEQALGFSRVAVTAPGATAPGVPAVATLALGGQTIELACFDPGGRAYPADRAANDPWFQHFAIAVSDMSAAYARLEGSGHRSISTGGPQQLPPSTGSVVAYKFRDPEGHPLELSFNPAVPAGANAATFLGIDHSAIAVADLDRSVAFYTGVLGLIYGVHLVNIGPAQDRLDGLADTRVDIVTLQTAEAGPHLELLYYASPRAARSDDLPAPGDVAATRLIMAVDDLAGMTERLMEAGAAFVTFPGERTIIRDPDGHLIELFERA